MALLISIVQKGSVDWATEKLFQEAREELLKSMEAMQSADTD